MALRTKCQTPGAVVHTEITDNMEHTQTQVNITVDLPFLREFNTWEAELLEANIHNALELVLARYFKES